MMRFSTRFSSSLLPLVLGLVFNASVATAAEPYTWGIGHGEILRDDPLASLTWEFVYEPNQSAAWTIPDLPPLDPTDTALGHDLTLIAHRGTDPVDFDGFGAALASPLFRSELTMDGMLTRSDWESGQSNYWNHIQIDTIEIQIHYDRSSGGGWSFWPSLYLSGTAVPVPEPSGVGGIALAAIALLRCHRRRFSRP
jgi:hypothetical protein